MNSTDELERATSAQQAAEWFMTNRDGPLSEEDRECFFAWLRSSPLHVEEYLGVAAIARDLPAATDHPDIALDALIAEARGRTGNVISLQKRLAPLRATGSPTHARWRRPLVAAAGVGVLALCASLVWWTRSGERLDLPQTYRTVHGEQRTWPLPDGSVLHLNSDSAVTVHYTNRERVAAIERGQALFQVAHERARRFRVTSGSAEVLAIGTRFDVYRKPEVTVVTVVEGKVAVFTGDPPPITPTAVVPENAVRVSAGQQVRIDATIVPARLAPVELRRAVAWLQREIVFEQRPLGEVAAEFNRYGRIPIEIDDAMLRALPVSGAFNAYDTDSFALFLERLEGVTVQRTPTRIRVLTRSLPAGREALSVVR